MISIGADGRKLVVRIDMDQAHPTIDALWNAIQRAAGHPQITRAAYAALMQSVAQFIAETGPDMWAEIRKLNAEALEDGQL